MNDNLLEAADILKDVDITDDLNRPYPELELQVAMVKALIGIGEELNEMNRRNEVKTVLPVNKKGKL